MMMTMLTVIMMMTVSMMVMTRMFVFYRPTRVISSDTRSLAEITVENNSSPQLQVQLPDEAGNVTVHPRLNVVCKVNIKSVAV